MILFRDFFLLKLDCVFNRESATSLRSIAVIMIDSINTVNASDLFVEVVLVAVVLVVLVKYYYPMSRNLFYVNVCLCVCVCLSVCLFCL